MVVFSEHTEQKIIVEALRASGICFAAIPNGGKRAKGTARKLKLEGLAPGMPDLLIFDPVAGFVGCALEMKRSKGGRLSPVQKKWLKNLEARNWHCIVGFGADDAIQKLRGVGYAI